MSEKRSKQPGLAVLKKPTQQKEWIQQTYTAPKTDWQGQKNKLCYGWTIQKGKAI